MGFEWEMVRPSALPAWEEASEPVGQEMIKAVRERKGKYDVAGMSFDEHGSVDV